MVSQMDACSIEEYLSDMIGALHRIVSATKLRDDSQYGERGDLVVVMLYQTRPPSPLAGELKTLTLELQQLLQEKVGGTKYSYLYSEAQEAAGLAKVERKEKETEKASEQRYQSSFDVKNKRHSRYIRLSEIPLLSPNAVIKENLSNVKERSGRLPLHCEWILPR